MKQPISDVVLGAFLLSCATLSLEATRLANEINKMTEKQCSECKNVLTSEEASEDNICDNCYNALMDDQARERRHPDDQSDKFRVN